MPNLSGPDRFQTHYRFENVGDFNLDGVLDNLAVDVDEHGRLAQAAISYRKDNGGVHRLVPLVLPYSGAVSDEAAYEMASPLYPSYRITFSDELTQKFHLETLPPVEDDYMQAAPSQSFDIIGWDGKWTRLSSQQGSMASPQQAEAVTVCEQIAPEFQYFTDETQDSAVYAHTIEVLWPRS